MTAVTEDARIEQDAGGQALSEPLVLAAEGVQVGRKLPTVEIVAYSGGVMAVPRWGDVVIDLAGLDAGTGEVVILADHDSKRTGVVGHGSASIEGGKLIVRGRISGDSAAAREVVRAARNGFPWQASVGVQPVETRRLRPGESIQINNQTVTAPKGSGASGGGAVLITKGRLREVSITALGCDAETQVRIAAMRQEGNTPMDTVKDDAQTTATTGVAEIDEAERIEKIEAIYRRHDPEGKSELMQKLRARAIDENMAPEEVAEWMPRLVRAEPPGRWYGPSVTTEQMLQAALLTYMGQEALGQRELGPRAMARVKQYTPTSLMDVCRAALQSEAMDVPPGRMAMVKAALSTYSLPVALGNVANKIMLDAYAVGPDTVKVKLIVDNAYTCQHALRLDPA